MFAFSRPLLQDRREVLTATSTSGNATVPGQLAGRSGEAM